MMLLCITILNNYFIWLLVCLFFSTNYAQQTDEVSAVSFEVHDYLEKVCNGSPTCHLVDNVPQNYRDLGVRNCMCDNRCTDYGDCCEDSPTLKLSVQRENVTFKCVETVVDGNVYMITGCLAKWNHSDSVAQNCRLNDTNILTIDVLTSTPVTNFNTGRTYRNLFCALCNEENEFEFWDILVSYDGLFRNTSNVFPTTLVRNADDILNDFKVNDQYYWQFTNKKAGLINNKCYLNATVPKTLMDFVRRCTPNVINTCPPERDDKDCVENHLAYIRINDKIYKNKFCARCNNVSLNGSNICALDMMKLPVLRPNATMYDPYVVSIADQRIPKIQTRCKEIPPSFPANEFCAPEHEASSPTTPSIRTCFPTRKDLYPPKPCLLNVILHKNDPQLAFVDDNETVIFSDTKYRLDEEFFYAYNNETVMICGTYVDSPTHTQFILALDDVLTSVLIKISIVCLFLQLLMFQQLPELKNISGKNLACFSATLMIAFVSYDIGPRVRIWTGSCRIVAIILHYTLLSCFTWMLIMSYDCWLSLYRATAQFRTPASKGHIMKFTIYCVICWTLPLCLVAYPTYLEFSPTHDDICNLHPGYGMPENCFVFNAKAVYYFFFIPASVSFVGNIGFFTHTAYMIYLSQRTSVNPNSRNDFKLYTRLALMMGLTWTLGSLTYVTNSQIVGLMFTIMNMSQGIFIFFGFTFKKKFIKLLLEKHKNNRFWTATLSTFVLSEVNTKVASENRTETEAV